MINGRWLHVRLDTNICVSLLRILCSFAYSVKEVTGDF
jgi:hypothetical protein